MAGCTLFFEEMKKKKTIDPSVCETVLEHTQTSVVVTDGDGIVEYVNTRFIDDTGYSSDEVVGKKSFCFESPHHIESFYEDLWSDITSGKFWKGELVLSGKGDELIYGNGTIKPVAGKNGERDRLIILMKFASADSKEMDFTSRRERILNDIQSLSKTGGWEYDVQTKNMYWTDELYRIHGFNRAFKDDHIKRSIQCYKEEDRLLVEKAFQDCLLHGKDYDLTVGFTDINGNDKWLRTKSSALRDQKGNVKKILGSVKDVTEEVMYELALKAGEKKLRDVVNSFDDIVIVYDTNGRHSEIYGKWAADQELRNHLIGKTAVEALGEVDGAIHQKAFNEVLDTGSVTYNWSYNNDGAVSYYQMKLSRVKNRDGKVTGILGVSRNVTTETEVTRNLKETKDRLSRALEGTQAGMWNWYLPDNRVEIDDQWAKLLGYKKEELTPCTIDTWVNLTHKNDVDKVLNKAYKVINSSGNQMFETQFRMRHKKGYWVWILSRGKASDIDSKGVVTQLTGTHIDISQRKHAEEERFKSEKRYRDLFTKSSDANLLIKDGIIFDCNRAAVRLLGFGKKTSLIGKSPLEFTPEKQPDGRISSDLQRQYTKRLNNKRGIAFDWYLRHKNGELFPVDVVITPITVDEGKQAGYVVLRDITNRIKTEEALKNSLKEKSALLSEVHHRVKNNLAVISGLMQLQVFKSDSEENTRVLNKSINRISSIALIHEQLYASENFSRLSLKDHIEKQVDYIRDLFREQKKKIDIKLNLADVHININQALPVGLMLNEILTNAFKYAFKDREEGVIEIGLRREGEYIDITAKDNGVGVEGEISRNNSLGVNLIEIFAQQLEATLGTDTKKGVSYHIRFKEREVRGSIESSNLV